MGEDYEHFCFYCLKIRIHLRERERAKKNKRRFWVKKIFERKEKSEFNILIKEMKLNDHE